MPGNDRERSKLCSFIQDLCLRPTAKDLGITRVDVVFHLSHFLFKRNLSEKYLPGRDSNRGPFAQQSSALPTELQKPCYGGGGKFDNQASDLAPVLALVVLRNK